ncbi:BamA/TamA family outer membrane protein [Vitiosangium sp. GDMCC 1.1324]|uniref:BamA/TamA family outer membrane protein n=1 Tax=Vitiosangium sp. (strain GDMCC 1.1324) TaxID=2138576 RepID=UPI000D3764C1|nr:BamA/TamA family outer membrane protein [Vitiosangium sp. GDMCC 1.1324]PTL84370.1 hypothetical protein DAT35_04540 [Vitiosangium sp. GDMCC 1.1324]
MTWKKWAALFVLLGGAASGEEAVSTQGQLNVVPFLLPAYQPETGWMLGSAAALVHQPPPGSKLKESQVLLAAVASLKGQFSLLLQPDWYVLEDRLHFGGTVSVARFPDSFFGVGNATRAQDEEPYTPIYLELELSPKWNLGGGFYLGPSFRLQHARIVEVEPGGLLETGGSPGASGGTTVQLGVSALWDTRDSALYPRKGSLVRGFLRIAQPALGSQYDSDVLRLDGRHYLTLPWAGHVLALQGLVELRRGEPPFYDTGKLGGGEIMRGYYEGRFRDRQHLALQAEYRAPLFWRLGAVAFASVGTVARSLDDLRLTSLKPAGGAGLRLAPLPDVPVNIRLDVAYGTDVQFYLNIGEAF